MASRPRQFGGEASASSSSTSSRRPPRLPRSHPPSASQPLSFTDEDEAISAGVEHEERGERSAYGPKALRAYQSALECYQVYARRGEQGANAAYNAARVLHILADGFYMPRRAFGALREARDLYGSALLTARGRVERGGNGDDATFALDVASNIGALALTLIEVMTNHSPQGVGPHIVGMTNEVVGLMEEVAAEQEKVLAAQLRDEQQQQQQQPGEGATAESSQSSTAASSPAPSGPSSPTYTSSLIVPSSLLDTFSTLHSLHLSGLLPHASTPHDIQEVARRMSAIMSRAQDFVSACEAANGWGKRTSPDDDWEQGLATLQSGSDEAEVAVLGQMTTIAQTAEEEAAITQEAVRLARTRLSTIDAQLKNKASLTDAAAQLPTTKRQSFWARKVEEMTEWATQAVTLARLLLRLALRLQSRSATSSASSDGSTNTTAEVDDLLLLRLSFTLSTSTSQLYLYLTTLLDTTTGAGALGVAAVLGSTTSLSPTSLQRSDLWTSLSDVTLLRSHAAFATLRSPAVVSDATRGTMQDNARVYARKALGQVGLDWVLDAATTDRAIQQRLLVTERRGSQVPPRGFEAVETQAQALLGAARAMFHRKEFRPAGAMRAAAGQGEESDRELQALALAVKALRQGRDSSSDGNGAQLEEEESGDWVSRQGWRVALDPRAWWEALADEESAKEEGNVRAEEEHFWRIEWARATRIEGEEEEEQRDGAGETMTQ